jgi:serine/threonine-protein kinase
LNPTPGSIIANRFQLVRELGRGSMGTVWLANHLTLDVRCAVKFMTVEPGQEALYSARFALEARAIAQVQSPYIVRVLDYDLWEGTPFIAMELLVGEDLAARLQHAKRLDPVTTHRIVNQVSKGLAGAHAAGIVHRDLKPENIFLAKEGDEEIAKLVDFGIVKFEGRAGRKTQVGEVLGTPMYMSPEQARSSDAADLRADLWSLAVIAYECLTGSAAFDGTSLGDIFARIMYEPLPVPSQVAPDLPPAFDLWWQRAVSRDIEARFADAREMANALARALGVYDATPTTGTRLQRLELVEEDPQPSFRATAPSRDDMNTDPSAILASRHLMEAEPVEIPRRRYGRWVVAGVLVASMIPLARLAPKVERADLPARIRTAASALTAPLPASAAPGAAHVPPPPAEVASAPREVLAPLPSSVEVEPPAPAASETAEAPAPEPEAAPAPVRSVAKGPTIRRNRHRRPVVVEPAPVVAVPIIATEIQRAECAPGQRRCSGSVLQVCNATQDGWKDSVDCGSAVCDATSAGPCRAAEPPPSDDNPYVVP